MKRTFNRECMKKMNGKIKVYKIASYDIETDTSDNMNRFLFGGFIDSNGKYKCFTDKDKMIEYMIKHVDKDTWVYATNNSFDHYALFGHKKDFLHEPPLMRGNLLMNAKYHGINTFDTRSYSKASVKSLGQMLGLPKGEGKFEFYNKTLLEPKHRQMFRRAREYNKRDCEITREFMIGFQKVLNELGGNLKITIGSCAMDLFKRKYLQEDIQHEYVKTFRDGTFLKDFLSEAYHGGRTEVFCRAVEGVPRNEEKIYYYYDFNSLYPSVMLYAYPKPSSCQLTMSERGKLNISSILNFEGCSQIEGVSPYMEYPVLPMVVNKKLCFTVGNIEGVFTHVELRRFLECGGVITKIYKTACYTKTFKPFEKWVSELYSLRLKYSNENNTIYKEIIKLYLNNLYGKFFQRNIMNMEFISLDDRNDDDLSQEGFTFDREIGFGYRETPKESNQAFIIPIFAVYTTAYARLKLHHYLVELKGLYCDSVSKNSLINIGNEISVEEYWNKHTSNIYTDRDKEFANCTMPILTCDSKINYYEIPLRIIRHKIKSKLVRVYLNNSEYIECTPNHSLIDINMNSIKANDLKVGNKILYLTKLPHHREINKSFSEKEFELLGHILANGNLMKNINAKKYSTIQLSSKYINTIFENVILPIKNKYNFNITRRKNKTDILINCTNFANKIYEYGLYGNSITKRVPKALQYESKDNIKAFLRGYFNGDGSLSVRNNTPIIKVDSINKELLKGISKLLHLIGIAHSYSEEPKNTHYKDKISKYNMKRINILDRFIFMKEIGFNNGSILNKKFNLNVERRNINLNYMERRIIKIQEFEYDDYVYDFEIPKCQRFYANNILVHNTDSILTEIKIPTSKNLGDVKLECECNDFVPFKPKDYRYFDLTNKKPVYKTKGVRLGDNPRDDFDKINRGEKIDQKRFGTIKEAIRSRGKFIPNQVRMTTKTFVSKDEKRYWTGEFNENGLEISKPIMFGFKTPANLDYYFRTRAKSNM